MLALPMPKSLRGLRRLENTGGTEDPGLAGSVEEVEEATTGMDRAKETLIMVRLRSDPILSRCLGLPKPDTEMKGLELGDKRRCALFILSRNDTFISVFFPYIIKF